LPGDEAEDLDGLIRRVDPDRWLTSRFIADPAARADVLALYAFDHELARARAVASNPLMAEIRLTWWREALDEIFGAGPPRRHPAAQALAGAVERDGLPRAPLEAMIDGQIEALETPELNADAAIRWADAVQGAVAQLSAMILDPASQATLAAPAGRAWGLALVQRGRLAAPEIIAPLLREALIEARRAARNLSAAAFPAALPARLARFDLAGQTPGPLRKQASLILAVAMGRI
jgi:15-cis-phytoene synthase